MQIGLIEGLLDAQIGGARRSAGLVRSSLSANSPVAVKVVPDDLNIDRSRQPEVQDLADDVGGKKGKGHAREIARAKLQAQVVHVLVGRRGGRSFRLTRMSASAGPMGAELL